MAKKLEESLENQRCRVKRLEIDRRGCIKVIIEARFGEYELSLKKNIARRLLPGDILACKLELDASPDFIGDRVEHMKVATMSYALTELKDKRGEVIYKK